MATLAQLQSSIQDLFELHFLEDNGGPATQVISAPFDSVQQVQELYKAKSYRDQVMFLSYPTTQTYAQGQGVGNNQKCRIKTTYNYFACFVSQDFEDYAARFAICDTVRALMMGEICGYTLTGAERPTGTNPTDIIFLGNQDVYPPGSIALYSFYRFNVSLWGVGV